MTITEMCKDVVVELARRGGPRITAEELFNASPTGELSHIFVLYWAYFPERLPHDVKDPVIGALRRGSFGDVQAWDGERWVV